MFARVRKVMQPSSERCSNIQQLIYIHMGKILGSRKVQAGSSQCWQLVSRHLQSPPRLVRPPRQNWTAARCGGLRATGLYLALCSSIPVGCNTQGSLPWKLSSTAPKSSAGSGYRRDSTSFAPESSASHHTSCIDRMTRTVLFPQCRRRQRDTRQSCTACDST